MGLTESDNVQTNWQARGSRSDAVFKGSATAQVLSCRIFHKGVSTNYSIVRSF